MAHITVNGTAHEIVDGLSVFELLTHLGIVPRLVVVEINQKVIYPELWKETVVNDCDSVEIVSFVGGG